MRCRVLVVADVRGWAWQHKALALQRHLSDEFEVDVAYCYDSGFQVSAATYDLIQTFEPPQVARLNLWHGVKIITGITCHAHYPVWEGMLGSPRALADVWHGASAVIANSALLKREVEAKFGREAVLCENGVDEVFWGPATPVPRDAGDELVVGFVGKKGHPKKGWPIVEEACRMADVTLSDVQTRARSPDLRTKEQMRDLYRDIHVLAVCSSFDGTPNPFLEAAAAGRATVGNMIGNIPEFVEDGVNGVLYEERTPECLAAAITRVKSMGLDQVEQMGRCARQTVEQAWTWQYKAESYRTLWRSVLR